MDQLFIDDEVIILGEGIDIDTLSENCNNIPNNHLFNNIFIMQIYIKNVKNQRLCTIKVAEMHIILIISIISTPTKSMSCPNLYNPI